MTLAPCLAQEVALIGMLGYLSYLCGELAGLSGIVTLFCCAVAISHYALHNISAPARVTLVRSCQTLSYVSEGAIFIYVGMDTLDPLKWKVTSESISQPMPPGSGHMQQMVFVRLEKCTASSWWLPWNISNS